MRRSTIESLSNPLVKRMRLLREKRHRRAEGLFLAEGLRIATEAREAGVLPHPLDQRVRQAFDVGTATARHGLNPRRSCP